jgi:hypothetical protein
MGALNESVVMDPFWHFAIGVVAGIVLTLLTQGSVRTRKD